MDQVKKKALKMCSLLMSYFVEHDIGKIDISIDFDQYCFMISLSGRTPGRPSDLDQMAAKLKQGRKPELDEYYEYLLETDTSSQGYYLLGAMVDESAVRYDGDRLSITIRRNNYTSR
jgi:hypothetical protein